MAGMAGDAPGGAPKLHCMSLQELSLAALENILRRLQGGRLEWTVLIYDDFARDLIAPILKIGDLRRMGITLHLALHSNRQPIPDAPAVYLCKPTEEAVRRVAKDCCEDMYRSYDVHWLRPIPRKLLELLAVELQQRTHLANITVKDQYLSFVSPEPDLFSLQMRDSYYTIATSFVSEEQIVSYLDEITQGITHVLLTLQMIPIVVSVRTGLAEELSRKIVDRIQDLIREHCLTPSAGAARLVLVLCDRNGDLNTALLQPFTYRALLHDSLGMELNKLRVGSNEYVLEEQDPIWKKLCGKELSCVMEEVPKETERWRRESEKDKKDMESDDMFGKDTSKLVNAMASASEKTNRKRYVDTHTNLAFALSTATNEQQLDGFNGVGEHLVQRLMDKEDILKMEELIKSNAPLSHRVRLALIHYLTVDMDDKAAMKLVQEHEEYLTSCAAAESRNSGAEGGSQAGLAAAFKYLKKIRGFALSSDREGRAQSTGMGGFLKTKGFGDVLKVFQGPGGYHMFPHTRIVDAVLGAKRTEERAKVLKQLHCVDAKTKQVIDITQFRFTTALLFAIGGGNYAEFQNLKDWEELEENRGKSVIYGTTELCTGAQFVKQLAALGQE